MAENGDRKDQERVEALRNAPTGGLPMADDRWLVAAPQWQANYQSLRLMDELALGEIEPATLFIWGAKRDEQE